MTTEPMDDTNRSEYPNELLNGGHQRMWEQVLVDANREAACTDYQQEFATWERAIENGLGFLSAALFTHPERWIADASRIGKDCWNASTSNPSGRPPAGL